MANLTHNFAKYKHFSIRTSLFDNYYQSKALTYRDIIHGKNILIKAVIQSFTPKNWQKYIEETEL